MSSLVRQVRALRHAFIVEHKALFVAQLTAFVKTHGYAPHPATLVGLVRAALREGKENN